MTTPRLAIIVSHPIQHFCPMYSLLAASPEWTIRVFFASASGALPYFDQDFSETICWTNLSLDTFPHEFLNGEQPLPINRSLDAPNLENRLATFDPHVIIVYGYSQRLQRRALQWAVRQKCPALMISDAELRQRQNLLKQAIKYVVIPRLLKQVTGFLTVGNANEHYYAHYGALPHTFYRAPFPIDINAYEQAWEQRQALREQQRAAWSVDNDQIVWLMVGKFSQHKRQCDAIDAAHIVQKSKKNIVLVLAGSGQCEQELKMRAQSLDGGQHVIFTGFVPAADLVALYAGADIYVHCSAKDRHPLAISEAAFMGLPVVASSTVGSIGPTDDVQVGRNGFWYPMGKVTQLASILARLSQDRVLREQMGQQSRHIGQKAQILANGQGLRAALVDLGLL